MAQVSLVRVNSWSSHDERISSTLSPPFPSTSSSSHPSLISCTSSCTSSTNLRAVVALRTSPERRWTLLTDPTSSQRVHGIARRTIIDPMHDEQPFCQNLTERRRTTARFLGQEKLQSHKDIAVQYIDFCEATTSKVHAVLRHAPADLRGGTFLQHPRVLVATVDYQENPHLCMQVFHDAMFQVFRGACIPSAPK